MTHRYCISSWVLRIWLTGTEDMTHGYCISSRVLRIWLTGTEDMTHGYCISSWVLRIWLTGTEDMTHGYCIPSRVLRIWLTGTDDMTHGYCIPSRVLHIVYTGWCHLFWLRLRHAMILISNNRTSASKKTNGMALIRTLTVSTTAFERTKENSMVFGRLPGGIQILNAINCQLFNNWRYR